MSGTKELGKLIPLKADLRNEEEILSAFAWIEENYEGVDVMVNNAGVLSTSYMIGKLIVNYRYSKKNALYEILNLNSIFCGFDVSIGIIGYIRLILQNLIHHVVWVK